MFCIFVDFSFWFVFLFCFRFFENVGLFEKYLYIVDGFVLQIVISNEFIGFGDVFCIYEYLFKICLTFFEKCLRSVNNSRTNYLFDFFEIWGVLNGPPSPPHTHTTSPRSPASMSKFPSRGKNMENIVFSMLVCDFCKKIEKVY